MKRSIMVLGILSIVIVVLVVTAGGAYAFPPGQWVSGISIANLEGDTANVVIVFHNQDGSTEFSLVSTIDPNSSKSFYLPLRAPELPDGYIGSAIVYSDNEIATSINTQLPSGTNPMRLGSAAGVGSPASTLYATQLMKALGGWNSYCAVQNTGVDEATVTVTYYDSTGAVLDSDSQQIASEGSYIFDQSTDPELPSGEMLSAKFESDVDHPLAAICNFYNSGASASSMQFHSYNPMSAGGSTLYIPRVVKDYANYQSGLKVQNIGTVPVSVTVSYNIEGTPYQQISPEFGPGQSWGPYMGNEVVLPPSMAGVSGSGSAVVDVNNPGSGKLIIATVNEDNRVSPAGRGATYEAAVVEDASYTLVFAQVTSEFFGYASGLQVMKVVSGTANCNAHWSASGNVSAFDQPFTLTDGNPDWKQFAPAAPGMVPGNSNDDYNGSVTVTCTGAKVVGIVNMSFRGDVDNRYGGLQGDNLSTVRGAAK